MNETTIGEAAQFIRGITFKPDQLIDVEDPDAIVCMRTKNVQETLNETDLIAVPSALVKNPEKQLKNGDILISSANSWELVGKCSYVGELDYPATAGGFIGIVRPRPHTHPRFLYHWLNTPQSQHNIRHCGRQTTNISNLDINRFRELKFPDLNLAEQRRIAAILDKSDAIRRRREEALTLADEFLRSVFLDMFGDLELNRREWKTKPISEILNSEPQNGLYKPSRDYGSGTQILRIDGFYDGYLATHKPLKRLRIDDPTLRKYRLQKGDVVINRVNSREYLGKSALIENLDEETVFESNMMRFSVNEAEANPRFLVDQLQTQFIKRQILRASKDAVNQSSINQTDVKNFEVRLPPIDLQEKYASIVRRKVANGSKQTESLRAAEALFASLSQRAFRGEL